MNLSQRRYMMAAIAAAFAWVTGAHAEFTYMQNDHDLLLFFRSSEAGDVNDLIVNLGPVEDWKTRPAGSVTAVTPTDITSTFGLFDTTVRWSLGAYAPPGSSTLLSPNYTVWASKASEPGHQRLSEDGQSDFGSRLMTVGQGAQNRGVDLSDTATRLADSDSGGYTVMGMNGTWNYFSSGTERRGAGSLLLFEMRPTDESGLQGELLGTFTFASDAGLSWAPVPEPSCYMAVAGGAWLLLAVVNRWRRRSSI